MKSRTARGHDLQAAKHQLRAAHPRTIALWSAALALLLVSMLLPGCSRQSKVSSPADNATMEAEKQPNGAADPCATPEGAASPDCNKKAGDATSGALAEVQGIAERACACENVTCAREVWEDFQKIMLKYRNQVGSEEEVKGVEEAAGRAFECLAKQGITQDEMTAFASQFDDTEDEPSHAGTAPAASGDAPYDESWWEDAIQFTEQLADLIDAHKDDCDVMGTELSTFIDDHKDMIERSNEMQKHPDAAKRFMEKYKDRVNAAVAKLAPLGQCANNPKVQEALQKLQ